MGGGWLSLAAFWAGFLSPPFGACTPLYELLSALVILLHSAGMIHVGLWNPDGTGPRPLPERLKGLQAQLLQRLLHTYGTGAILASSIVAVLLALP